MTHKFTFIILAFFALISDPGWGQSKGTGDSYELVTSAPTDWSGTYLFAYVNGANAYVYNGTDSGAKNGVSAAISNNAITFGNGMAEIEIASMEDGYSLKVIGGTNNGKYLSGGTSNGTTFGTTAVANSLSMNTDGTVKINNNTTTSFQFNSASDQQRFRYFKSAQKGVKLFKKQTTPSTDPAINADDEVNLAYDETSGSIPYTISNPVDEVELEANLQSGITWITNLTVGDESVSFNTTANDSDQSRSAEITLSYEGANDVIVTVNQDGIPVPTITCANITNVPYEGVSNATAAVTFNNADGWTPSITCDGTVVTAASLSENTVTYSVSENEEVTDREGSFTITLSKEGEEDVTKQVSVTQKHFVIDYAELPFSYDGGKSNLPTGLTHNGLGSDYSSSPKMKFDGDGDYLILKINENPGILSYKIKGNSLSGNYVFTLQVSADGINYTDQKNYTSIPSTETTETITDLDPDVRYIKWIYTTKDQGNVALGAINLAKEVAKYTVSLAQGIENGSISVSPTSAIAGSTITITPNAAEGYILANYTIYKTEDGTDVTGSVGLVGNTFTMPAYDVTVSATFTPALSYTVTIANIQHGTVNSVENEYFEGATVQLTVEPDPNYGLVSLTITKTEGGTATGIEPVLNAENGKYEFAMPAYDITVSASFGKIATYTRITSIDQLIVGRPYIIVGKKDGKYYTMGSQGDNNRPAIEIDADEMTARWLESDGLHEFFISGDAINHYSIYDELNQNPYTQYGFLYAASSSSNYLRTEETLDDNGKWAIGFDETGAASVVAQGTNTRKVMRFNSSSTLFSCYASSSQSPVYIYMKDNPFIYNIFSNTYIDGDYNIPSYTMFTLYEEAKLEVTGSINSNGFTFCMMEGTQLIHNNNIYNGWFYCSIIKYTESETNERTGWNLVALPINDYNMVAGTTIPSNGDLYSYDESIHFWINEKPNNPETYIPLQLGKGYLFALPEDSPSRFGSGGTLQPSNVDLSFPLSYASIDGRLKGFNLVGNPFTCNAYVNMPFMVLDETGSTFIPGNVIKPGDAILVQATAEGQEITFTRNAPTEPENRLDISVSQNRGSIIDNARIRFGGSHAMNKFYLNENSSRLYIPQNGEEFAVISAQSEGEMPLDFKAAQNGTYTITVNIENVEAEYLHLIDNMTGMDVDLLASTGSASYTFEAKTSDYASRFKLVFSMTGVEENASTSSANFAYISNGNLVIDNIEGETTLQIIDELGRIISTETVRGSYNKALNLMTGMYIINLNGMTQKIVVK